MTTSSDAASHDTTTSGTMEPVVVASLIDALVPILSETDAKRLLATRSSFRLKEPTTSRAEMARLQAILVYAFEFAAGVVAWADLPEYADLLRADALWMANVRNPPTTITVAALYRVLLDRLPNAGPQLRPRIKDAISVVRELLLANSVTGKSIIVGDIVLPTARIIELARMKDRAAWTKKVFDMVATIARGGEIQPRLPLDVDGDGDRV